MPVFAPRRPETPVAGNMCPRHPDEPSTVNCGNCGRAYCTRDVVLEAEGLRCVECRNLKNAAPTDVAPVKLTFTPVRHDPESGVAIYTCPRHPKEETRLTCGRCDQPICPRCMVYTSTGLRCPDCIYGKRGQTGATNVADMRRNFRAREADVARNMPLSQTDLLIGGIAALVVATLFGIVWGYLIDPNDPNRLYFGRTTLPRDVKMMFGAYLHTGIHLLPEIVLALVVSEVTLRVCQMRRGISLALVAGAATLWGLIVPLIILYQRSATELDGATSLTRDVGNALAEFVRSFDIVGGIVRLFSTGDLDYLQSFTLLWWILAVVLVVLRLRK